MTLSVCFTGKGEVAGLNDRNQWQGLAASIGFQLHKSVSSTTSLLVASRHNTTKAAAAAARGIPVWSYAEFYDFASYVEKTKWKIDEVFHSWEKYRQKREEEDDIDPQEAARNEAIEAAEAQDRAHEAWGLF